MADILSLSKARKTRVRDEKAAGATENRVKFGRTKVEKQRDQTAKATSVAKLDAHKRSE